MTYPDAPPPARNNTPVLVLGVLALVAVLGVGGFLVWRNSNDAGGKPGQSASLPSLPAALTPNALVSPELVARELERNPQSRATVVAFRETFPTEYAALTRDMAARIRSGSTPQQLQQYAFDTMRNFSLSRAGSLAAAPQAELRQVTTTQLALAQALQGVDPPMCARFTASGLGPGDVATFPPSAQDEMDAAIRAQLVGTRAGMDRPENRPQPTQDEIQQFLAAFQAAGGNVTILQASGSYPIGDGIEACRSGVAVYQAVANLPPETSARVMGFILTQAAAAQGGGAGAPAPAPAAPAAAGGK